MAVDPETLGIGGGSGIFGGLLVFFGLKSRIERVDKDLQAHKENVVYTKTFDATMKPVTEDIAEMRSDIKKLLIKSTQRRATD